MFKIEPNIIKKLCLGNFWELVPWSFIKTIFENFHLREVFIENYHNILERFNNIYLKYAVFSVCNFIKEFVQIFAKNSKRILHLSSLDFIKETSIEFFLLMIFYLHFLRIQLRTLESLSLFPGNTISFNRMLARVYVS